MKTLKWKKHVLCEQFVSESCCFAEITDGKIVFIAGEYKWTITDTVLKEKIREIEDAWLPDWPYKNIVDPHAELRKTGGPPQYKADTYDFYCDINDDKNVLITVGMHKDPIYYYTETEKYIWEKKLLTDGGIYESVICTDLFDEGRNIIITVPQKPYLAWYEPSDNKDEKWKCNYIGCKGGDWHGLGVGDVNGDGKKEIITQDGLYRSTSKHEWKWIPIYVYDENGTVSNGLGDVFKIVVENNCENNPLLFSTSPHGFGFWYWRVKKCDEEGIFLEKKKICDDVSQLHNIMSLKVDDTIFVCTGKRKYAHGKKGDVDQEGKAKLLLFQIDKQGREHLEIIDDNSGAGINFDFKYYNNKFYIVTSNKCGVFLFEGEEVC